VVENDVPPIEEGYNPWATSKEAPLIADTTTVVIKAHKTLWNFSRFLG
jgi:hypothetical protein